MSEFRWSAPAWGQSLRGHCMITDLATSEWVQEGSSSHHCAEVRLIMLHYQEVKGLQEENLMISAEIIYMLVEKNNGYPRIMRKSLSIKAKMKESIYFKRRVSKTYFEWGPHTNTKDSRNRCEIVSNLTNHHLLLLNTYKNAKEHNSDLYLKQETRACLVFL